MIPKGHQDSAQFITSNWQEVAEVSSVEHLMVDVSASRTASNSLHGPPTWTTRCASPRKKSSARCSASIQLGTEESRHRQ